MSVPAPSATDERLKPALPLHLTQNEARALYDQIADECDMCSDCGSIPPQHWRTAATKLQHFLREWA